MTTKDDIYAPCSHIKQQAITSLNKGEEMDSQASDTILPLYEKRLFDQTRIKYSSLKTNEKLACRWRQYVLNVETKVRSPFQFPKSDDLHFHNQQMRYDPSLSIHNKPTHRIRSGPGPGVDHLGKQLPIPDDMQMTRYTEPRKTANSHKQK